MFLCYNGNVEYIKKKLIAACGMNCGICMAHLRGKEPCEGCFNPLPRYKSCLNCKMRNCEKRSGLFCFDCKDFPCDRLKHLDKRYRTKYNMSEIENLEFIKKHGISKFLEQQTTKYVCKKGVFNIHRKTYHPVK
jgi:hypothetical protein